VAVNFIESVETKKGGFLLLLLLLFCTKTKTIYLTRPRKRQTWLALRSRSAASRRLISHHFSSLVGRGALHSHTRSYS